MSSIISITALLAAGVALPAAGSESFETMNWAQMNIDGWQTTCDLKTQASELPTRCVAYYALSDGGISLEYRSASLTVSVLGKCMNDAGRSKTYPLGVTHVDQLIAQAAQRTAKNCPPPVLTPQVYEGLPSLNALLTFVVGSHS